MVAPGSLRLACALVPLLLTARCAKKSNDEATSAPARSAGNTSGGATPPAVFNSTPVAAFADASSIDGKSPYEQAKAYELKGQHWLARLVLEQKALGPSATPEETELLAAICHEQGDVTCLEACTARLGRKLKFDGGTARAPAFAGEHKEPDSDAARARDLLLRNRVVEARKILEAQVLDGKASNEEIRLLKSVCQEQADRMCVALCDAKLK